MIILKNHITRLCIFISIISQISNAHMNPKDEKKHAVIVLGTGRSGTSCLTGVLQIMGLYLGDNLSKPSQHNAKGAFEDTQAAQLHREILKGLGKPIRGIEYNLKLHNHPQYIAIKSKIKDLLKNKFGDVESFGAKFPYIEWLLPIYIEVLEELDFTPYFIISLRNPNEIVDSFVSGDPEVSREFFAIRNVASLMAILEHTVNHKTLIIHYDDLLYNSEEVVKKIHTFIPGLRDYNSIKTKLDSFLDKSLKHQQSTNRRL